MHGRLFALPIMNKRTIAVAALLVLASALPAAAGELSCAGEGGNVEEFRYSWRLRGGIRFIAGLVFPTRGDGTLRTTFPSQGSSGAIHSELVITAPEGRSGGYYAYESEIDRRDGKTLETYHGYMWGSKERHERLRFDYAKGLARISKTTPDKDEKKVKKLPANDEHFRDVLTAIYFLRHNATTLKKPMQTNVFSDGKDYPVVFKPIGTRSFEIEGKQTQALGFEIVDAPGGKKWPGDVKVWLSNDDRRIPVRIEIAQSIASMQLDLQGMHTCTGLMARF
jgi:hypothetical protein